MIAHGIAMLGSEIRFRRRELLTLLLGSNLLCMAAAQDATSAMKQADAAFRAGSAALSQNDLQAALIDFRESRSPCSCRGAGIHKPWADAAAHGQNPGERAQVWKRLSRSSPATRQRSWVLPSPTSDSVSPRKNSSCWQSSMPRLEPRSMLCRPTPRAMYAFALAATHQLPAAVMRMKQAVAADPAKCRLLWMTWVRFTPCRKTGRTPKKISAQLWPGETGAPSAHLHLAWRYRPSSAPVELRKLNAAYQLDPENPIINLELGRLLAANGDDQQAIPLLQHATRAAAAIRRCGLPARPRVTALEPAC